MQRMSPDQLNIEIQAHIKRALVTMEELEALLHVQGASYSQVMSVAQEISGHLGYIQALCRAGLTIKLRTDGTLEEGPQRTA